MKWALKWKKKIHCRNSSKIK